VAVSLGSALVMPQINGFYDNAQFAPCRSKVAFSFVEAEISNSFPQQKLSFVYS